MKIKIKNKKVILTTIAAVISIAGGLIYMNMQGGQEVETVAVEKGEIKQYIEDTAVVQANKKQTVYIEGSGRINSIKVKVGDSVNKGDVLLTMDTGDLELKLKDADSKIKAAKAQLASTDASNYANKIEISQSAVDAAKVTYDTAKRNFDNAKTLFEAGAMSEQELKNAEDSFKSSEAGVKSANSQLKEAKDGAPEYMKRGYIAAVEQAVILKDSIVREIEKQQVTAGIDGIVIEKLVEENSIGAPATAAFLLGDVKSLELESNILADDIYNVHIGNEVEVSGKAIGDSKLKGKVIKIAPEAKNITSSLGVNQKRVAVTIEITDGIEGLKPGFDLDSKIITKMKNDTLIIPDTAVFDYKGNSCVFAVENGKTILKQIKKGIESDKTIEVLEGLEEGEKIILKPDNNIKEGIKIKI
jgi:HlyD family secretion protein